MAAPRGPDHPLGEVGAGGLGAARRCGGRQVAEPTADVEHPHAGGHAGGVEQRLDRLRGRAADERVEGRRPVAPARRLERLVLVHLHRGRRLLGTEVEPDQLRARGDAELREHLAQVVLDRLRADEQLRGDALVGGALADQPRDLQLLRGELGQRADVALAGGLAGRPQLAPRALGPGTAPSRSKPSSAARRWTRASIRRRSRRRCSP